MAARPDRATAGEGNLRRRVESQRVRIGELRARSTAAKRSEKQVRRRLDHSRRTMAEQRRRVERAEARTAALHARPLVAFGLGLDAGARRLRRTSAATRAVALLAALLLVAALGVLGWWVAGGWGLLYVGSLLLVAAVAGLAVLGVAAVTARLAGSVDRLVQSAADQRSERDVAARQAEETTQAARQQVDDLVGQVAALKGTVAGLERRVRESNRARALATVRQTQQIEATVNLFTMLQPPGPTPGTGGWAASADVVRLMVGEVLADEPRLVVECGSGASTVWLSLLAKTRGLRTRVVALEHEEQYAEATRRTLRTLGLEEYAEVRSAPLETVRVGHYEGPWYSPAALEGLSEIGLLFVDGPPGTLADNIRYPAVPLLRDAFAARCTVVLDDADRPDERDVADRWVVDLPDFTLEQVPLEKGAAVLRRR